MIKIIGAEYPYVHVTSSNGEILTHSENFTSLQSAFKNVHALMGQFDCKSAIVEVVRTNSTYYRLYKGGQKEKLTVIKGQKFETTNGGVGATINFRGHKLEMQAKTEELLLKKLQNYYTEKVYIGPRDVYFKLSYFKS